MNLVVLSFAVRQNLGGDKKEFGNTEDNLKSLQSVSRIIGELLRLLMLTSLFSSGTFSS